MTILPTLDQSQDLASHLQQAFTALGQPQPQGLLVSVAHYLIQHGHAYPPVQHS